MKFLPFSRFAGWLIPLLAAGSLAAAPVGSWQFDETSGSVAADSSGNGRNATIYGTAGWTAGHTNGALQFDGTTTYGKVADSPLFDGTDKLTISCWVKPEGLDGNPRFILSKRSGTLQNCSYGLFFGQGNKMYFDINLGSSTGDRVSSQTVFENDQWYQVTLVFDGAAHASQRAKLYVNGTLDRDAALTTAFIPDHDSPLFIGIGHTGYPYKFKGLLDDLSVSRELPSPAETSAMHQGLWTLEKWNDMPYKETSELLSDPRYFHLPGTKEVVREAGKDLGWYLDGGRFRGQITVPVDGRYVFWISARTSADLYLSSDEFPYAKRKIANMSPGSGTGDGIRSTDSNLWDRFESQMSEPVELLAGRKYYIESIAQVSLGDLSHVRLAWAPENGSRTGIPASALSYYIIPPEDMDDDSLPDAWETTTGLDPADNGGIDMPRQGENGDHDADGLTNREEYLLGTDPRDADSDGDGRSDYDEHHTYGSDPLQSDSPSENLVGTVDINTFSSPDDWLFIDGGLLPETFRGEISWNFTVSNTGIYLLHASTRVRGKPTDSEHVDVNVFIDGKSLGRHTIHFGATHEALLRIVTPHLTVGGHTLKFEIDNNIARRSVQILGIDILQPSGDDLDNDGMVDWLEILLAETDTTSPHGTSSVTSPFFLEGNARLAGEVLVNGSPVIRGVDESHWFANIALSASADTPWQVSYASGLSASGSVSWQATNVLDGGTLAVRNGDSLKLGAWISDGSGLATVDVAHGIPALPSGVSSGLTGETVDVAEGTGALRIPATGGQHVRITDSDELDGTDKLTISFHAKPDASSLDGLPRGIISKRTGSGNGAAYSVFTYTGGRLFIDLDVGTSTPLRVDTGYVMLPQWQQVRIVFDGTLPVADRLKVHVNGTLVKKASVSVSSIRNLSSNLHVGTLNSGYSSGGNLVGFGGLIDGVSITRAVPATNMSTTIRLPFDVAGALGTQRNQIAARHTVTGTDTFTAAFDSASGPYQISAVHGSGSSGTLTVNVPKANLPDVTLLQNNLRYLVLNNGDVDPSLVLQTSPSLRIGSREIVDSASYRHALYPERGGSLGIAARLGNGGPIADISQVTVVGMTAATVNDLTTPSVPEFPGYTVQVSPLLVTDLPPGGSVKITIFRAGAYFDDGSTVKILTADDFENGVYFLRVLMSDTISGGFCHYIDVYDANGKHIGRQ